MRSFALVQNRVCDVSSLYIGSCMGSIWQASEGTGFSCTCPGAQAVHCTSAGSSQSPASLALTHTWIPRPLALGRVLFLWGVQQRPSSAASVETSLQGSQWKHVSFHWTHCFPTPGPASCPSGHPAPLDWLSLLFRALSTVHWPPACVLIPLTTNRYAPGGKRETGRVGAFSNFFLAFIMGPVVRGLPVTFLLAYALIGCSGTWQISSLQLSSAPDNQGRWEIAKGKILGNNVLLPHFTGKYNLLSESMIQ